MKPGYIIMTFNTVHSNHMGLKHFDSNFARAPTTAHNNQQNQFYNNVMLASTLQQDVSLIPPTRKYSSEPIV